MANAVTKLWPDRNVATLLRAMLFCWWVISMVNLAAAAVFTPPAAPGRNTQPSFLLEAPDSARVGELIKLSVSISQSNGPWQYRFVYSDMTSEWSSEPRTFRLLTQPGEIRIYAEARLVKTRLAGRSIQSETKIIRVLPALPTINLRTLTANPKAGQLVQWRITITPRGQSQHYVFDPGDHTGTIDGKTATIDHTYTTAGTFAATVQLLDAESSPRDQVMVSVAPAPAPTLTVTPATAEIGENIILSAGYSAQDRTARFRFRFDDNEAPSPWSSEGTIVHRYRQAGTYAPYVEVTHENGSDAHPEAHSSPREIKILPEPSVALEASSLRACVGDEITFKTTSNRPDLRFQFTLDFGDGEKQPVSDHGTVTHVFKEATTFDVTVVGATKTGRATAQQRIVIAGAPSPTLDVSPSAAEIDSIIQFVAGYARADQRTRYRFSFGDGTPPSPWLASPRINRRYAQSGSFKAAVEIGVALNTASNGTPLLLGGSFPKEIIIRPTLAVKIQTTTPQVHVGEEAIFTVTTNREDLPTNYTYTFTDGMHSGTSSATSASHIFVRAGDYTAAVLASATSRATATDEVRFTVLAAVAPKLTAEPASPEIGELVKFTAVSASSGPQFRYRFNFGDKTPLSDWLATPVTQHAYQQNGNYQPSVEVGVVRGQKTENLSTGAETSVTVPPPFDFSLLPPSGEIRAGHTIGFERKTNRPQTPASVSVDFGDGSSVETFAPGTSITHKFSRSGSYTVKWTADAGHAPRARGDFVLVIASSVPTWVILLTSLAGAIALGMVPHHFGWIVPSLHPKPNFGTVKLKAKAVPSAEMEIRLNRNLPSLRSTLVVKIKPRVDVPEKLHV